MLYNAQASPPIPRIIWSKISRVPWLRNPDIKITLPPHSSFLFHKYLREHVMGILFLCLS